MSAHVPARPMTVVETDAKVSIDELARRVVRSRDLHGDMLQEYHRVWYESGHTWHYTHFANLGLMKCPNDLWAYQELIAEYRPVTIIETGTYQGGSALWFAFLLDLLQVPDGHVYTIDIDDHRACTHPRITFLGGDSIDPAVVDALAETLADRPVGPRLFSLDSDHSASHVRRELELYAPLVQVGDWLVVEDTNISWLGEGGDRGASGGLDDYLRAHPGEFVQDVLCERWLLTMHPGGWLRRVAPHV